MATGEVESTVRCPVCGVCQSRPWTWEDKWKVLRCSGCDLLITWPRPNDATLTGIYDDEGYYERRSMGSGAGTAWNERARAILETLSFSPRSVLDFGAGEGHLVSAFRGMGLVAEGVETSASGRAAARQMYKLELRDEVPADLRGQFQLVTLVHSLEHVADPVKVLANLTPMLEPDGIVFIEVPHAWSIDMWWPHRRREILDLPVHLYHFVPETLARVVEHAGLHVVEIRLSNPGMLEWAFKVRARRSHVRRTNEDRAPGNVVGRPPGNMEASRVRLVWSSRLLPWVRRHFPGGKLQLLATRPS